MTTETESSALIIQKIKKQKDEIIDEISKRERSKNLYQIEIWIKQIDLESPPINISLVAITIDTIFFHFKNEINKENKNLIENCLCNLINKLSKQPNPDEISVVVSNLKAYIKANDNDDKYELEKFIGNLASSAYPLSLISTISEQTALIYKKIESNVSNIFNTQLNDIPITALTAESHKKCQIPFESIANSRSFTNNSSKNNEEKNSRKKNKTRIIDFDEDGKGYDINSPYLFSKEIKRLSEMSLEIKSSPKKRFEEECKRLGKIYINEEHFLNMLQKQIAEKEFQLFADEEEKKARLVAENAKRLNIEKNIKKTSKNREYLKHQQKKGAKAKKISKLLDPIVSIIQDEINQCKRESLNNNKYSLNLKLPIFEVNKDRFSDAYLATINYDQFKELINYAKSIFVTINQAQKTLNKIDDFFRSLGFSFKHFKLDDSKEKIKKFFNNDSIINFFEMSLNLYRQRTLNFNNKYCLLNLKTKKKKIEFSEPIFLDKFISNNTPEVIFELLFTNIEQLLNFYKESQTLIRNRNLEKKDNIFKKLLNFFLAKYYFLDLSHKNKFVKKFFLNFQEPGNFELIKIEMLKLKWWNFILMGLNPFCVIKRGFKELLSKELFLCLIEEEFNKIDKEPSIKNIDAMYSIQDRLVSANISNKNSEIPLLSIEFSHSRQEIIDKLSDCVEMKKLLEKNLNLAKNATWCVNEFIELLNAYQKESEKKSPSANSANNLFFKNKTTQGSGFSISNMDNFSSSYVRGIN